MKNRKIPVFYPSKFLKTDCIFPIHMIFRSNYRKRENLCMVTKKILSIVILFVATGFVLAEELPSIFGTHSQVIQAREFLCKVGIRTTEDLYKELGKLNEQGPISEWLAVASTYRHLPNSRWWDS